MSNAIQLTKNSVATNFLFVHQGNVLADETKAATLRDNDNRILQGNHLNKHLPWIPDFLESLPHPLRRPMMPPGLIDMLDLFDRVHAEWVGIMKAKESGATSEKPIGLTGKESVYDSVLDNPSLPASEKILLRLEQEGALLVLAGTESPAHTLNTIFYHLIANPTILDKLRTELSTVPSPAHWTQLEQLPYLSAVIEEGHRLSFGVTIRTSPVVSELFTYNPSSYATASSSSVGQKSYTIPAGTPMSTSTMNAHTAETVFPSPFAFDPDRWLGEEGQGRRKFQMAFNKGSRKCLGVELASTELCLVVAALVRKFDMSLWETDASDVAFLHDYQVAMPRMGSQGVRVMAKHANH